MSTPVPIHAKPKGGFLRGLRVPPHHGYTPATISMKRVRENTSSLALTVNLILPTLQSINKALEKHVHDGDDVPVDELLTIFADSSTASAKMYADRLARVACQTCFACVLIRTGSPTANSMVYLWDLYPRLMRRYVGEVFDLMRIPRFLNDLLGPYPTAEDVVFLQSKATVVDAFTTSLQRNCVLAVGDVVVDSVLIVADRRIKGDQKPAIIVKKIFARCTTCVCWAVGAGVGRLVAGERGEYWGEYLGTVMAPTVVVEALALVGNVRKTRSKRGSQKISGAQPSHGIGSRSSASHTPAPA